MKKLIFILLIMFSYSRESMGQVQMDFIITVNDELEVGSLSNLRFVVRSKDGGKQEVEMQYHPGNLSIKESEYKQLFSDESDSVFVAFDHNKFCGEKHDLVNYEIPFYKSWLENSFIILRVYDLSKGKYKNVFEPLSKEKNYTFELDYPGGSMKRIMINKFQKKPKCK